MPESLAPVQVVPASAGISAFGPVCGCAESRKVRNSAPSGVVGLLISWVGVYWWDKSDTSARLNRARHAARFNRASTGWVPRSRAIPREPVTGLTSAAEGC